MKARRDVSTIFDRHILRRFLHVFAISFIATMGLYVVIDGFMNVDEFQGSDAGDNAAVGVWNAAKFYAYRSSEFLDSAGVPLAVISAMVVVASLERHSEIAPILAAGVSTYRLMVPFVVGTATLNVALIANQELIIPQIASQLRAPRGETEFAGQRVEPTYDSRGIWIGGQELFLGTRTLDHAAFVLPAPRIAHESTTITADQATYIKGVQKGQRSGWLLKGARPEFASLRLTSEGETCVTPFEEPDQLFIASEITIDQLYNRNTSYRFLSTKELVDRVRNPVVGRSSARDASLHLHARLTRPLWNLIVVLVAIPLVVRKESPSLLSNLATCAVYMGILFGTVQAFQYFGQLNLIGADFAAWGPVIVAGTLGAWATDQVRT